MQKAKFKIEMEVEVAYGDNEYTYTSAGCIINNANEVIVVLDKGAIQNAEIKKIERKQ